MLRLTDCLGRTVYVAAANVCRITEPPPEFMQSNINSVVYLFDNAVIECNEYPGNVARRVEEELKK